MTDPGSSPAEGILDQAVAAKTPEEQQALYVELAKQFGPGAAPPGVLPAAAPAPIAPAPVAPAEPAAAPPAEPAEPTAPPIEGIKIPEPPAPPEGENLFTKAEEELKTTGKISDATRKEIVDTTGVPDAYIDRHIAGQRALQQQAYDNVYAMVGGQEQFAEMVSWAQSNLTPGEIDAFNKAGNDGDLGAVEVMVKGIEARWKSAPGTTAAPAVRVGSGRQHVGPTATPFSSQSEYLQATQSTAYEQSQVFRAEVQARLLATDAGVLGF